ncbi:3-deoxy-7-phosphoheptulonate synthase [Streptomyces sp. NPDC006879]|uniref:3-deoxy-7-phosphoheptulonate synthase n=1 Tax=Streptomyces sp. NPDC006879 TaxID=3364767 RepID=UPI00368F3567
MDNSLLDVRLKPALQQPDWDDPAQLSRVRKELLARPPLVDGADVHALRRLLARVAEGEAHVVQAGDCAEDPDECTSEHVARKAAVLDLLAGTLRLITNKPVLRVGRIAGQYAKPRSNPTETIDGAELPVFRGHMVNGPEADPDSRRPDPLRLLTGYMAAEDVMRNLGWRGGHAGADIDPRVWTSHEALLLDYEVPMVRRDERGELVLTSTHWPWLGERTRQLGGAHLELLSQIANPVACKVGPSMTPGELLALCERLDPERTPGRLTLIARMGADKVPEVLPPLVTAVREAGHPVIWLTDPMHGNTITTPEGLKTRLVETVEREAVAFHYAVTAAGGTAGGFHLETTADAVTECAADPSGMDRVGHFYTSFCDPRLNPGQAISVVSSWSY